MSKKIKNITVLMPAYNSSRYIGCAIKSILNQTFKEFELLIVDDGSTDNTEEVIDKFKDSRTNYIKIKHKGISGALNFGVKKASYEWIARIDADDLNVPERIETQINFLKKNPDYDIVSSWSVYFRGNKILFFLQQPVEHSRIYEFLNLHNPINHSSVIYKKRIIAKAKYNENCTLNEDFELFHRLKDKVKFYNIPEYLAYIRVHKDSKSKSQYSKNVYDFTFREAVQNLMNSKSKRELYYWTTIIARLNFFYGDRRESRKYLLNSSSTKNFIAYLSTFLPEKYFNKLIDAHPRFRLQSFFKDKKKYKLQLNELLNV